jgi:hypothetical protein
MPRQPLLHMFDDTSVEIGAAVARRTPSPPGPDERARRFPKLVER